MVNRTHWNENNDVKIRNHPFTRMGAFCYSTSIYIKQLIENPEFLSVVFNFQQRLRNLIQINGYNLCDDPDCTANKSSFYYTLHLTTMCAPLYTSEKVCGRNPKWTKMDICSSIGSAKGI